VVRLGSATLVLVLAGCRFQTQAQSDAPASGDAPRAVDARETDAAHHDGGGIADAPAIDAPSGPGLGFVQGATNTNHDTQAITVTLTAPQGSGDLDLVAVSWTDPQTNIQVVSDGDGNTYQPAGSPVVLNTVGVLAVYVAPGVQASASSNPITVSFDNQVNVVAVAAQYTGVVTSDPIDVTNGHTGNNSTSLDSGGVSTGHSHDLVVGIAAATSAISAGNNYTERVDAAEGIDLIEDREVTMTGNVDATASIQFNGVWLIELVALKAAN
jgi:hypothetical protein